jgi:hypothetical protein
MAEGVDKKVELVGGVIIVRGGVMVGTNEVADGN